MARPKKNNADYFSHDGDMRNDDRILAVRNRYEHMGYAVWVMLLEKLTRAEGWKLGYDDEQVELWSGDFRVEKLRLKEIIAYFIGLQLLQRDASGNIFSEKLVKRFALLVKKREKDNKRVSASENQATITFPPAKTNMTDEPFGGGTNNKKEVIVSENSQGERVSDSENPPRDAVSDSENTQSKVKESKVNKSKEEGPPVVPQKENSGEEEKNIPPTAIPAATPPDPNISFSDMNGLENGSTGLAGRVSLFGRCKEYFLSQAPVGYVWNEEESGSDVLGLKALILKIRRSAEQEKKRRGFASWMANHDEVAQRFKRFIDGLPQWWREKKFSPSSLSYGYNEILNEILTGKAAQSKPGEEKVKEYSFKFV